MKRCPQCSFIYLDSDEHCDLDGTFLQLVDGSDIDQTPIHREDSHVFSVFTSKRLLTATLISVVLVVGLATVMFYLATRAESVSQTAEIAPLAIGSTTPPAIPTTFTSPLPSVSRSPSVAPAETTPGSSRALVSQKPVSTSASDTTKTHALIRLTSGVTIQADEVWRTREGIWYRKSGMVTLIKSNEVKAIEKAPAKVESR